MGSVPKKEYFQEIIDTRPKIKIGKRYDFKCEFEENRCYIYRRLFEGEPWEKAYRVFLDGNGKVLHSIVLEDKGLTYYAETKTAKVGSRRQNR